MDPITITLFNKLRSEDIIMNNHHSQLTYSIIFYKNEEFLMAKLGMGYYFLFVYMRSCP